VIADSTSRRQADDERFTALFESEKDRVYALCYRLCGHHADAEDALQETFIDVYRGLGGFRGDASHSTWIYKIAVRAALRVRGRAKSRAVTLPDDLSARTDVSAGLKEEARRTLEAIEKLSFEHRVVLHLFALEGMSHREIGEILAIPEGTVWSRLHTARRRLSVIMSGAGGAKAADQDRHGND
jgi:RNA polymerase sigma-70 factor (ECF subfamily)